MFFTRRATILKYNYYKVRSRYVYLRLLCPVGAIPRPDGDIKITRQNATYDRLELSYLVS